VFKCMSTFIVLRIGRRILVVIECFTRPAKIPVVCFGKVTTLIQSVTEGNWRPRRKIFRLSVAHCWIGTAKNLLAREKVPKRPIQSLGFADQGKKSGSAKRRMTTSTAFAEAGSEPNFWDTNLFIYLIEDFGDLSERVVGLRKRMVERGDELYTSALTLGEILIKPLEAGNEVLARRYESALLHGAGRHCSF
jgi:hypothetical protein